MLYSTNTNNAVANWFEFLRTKLADYAVLVKVKLNITVVFSAVVGYALAAGWYANLLDIILLGWSGFAITGSANAINQILEKDYDKLMKRTANRPLASGRMNNAEAAIVAGILGISGLALLGFWFNTIAALAGAISLFSYAFLYTPLKRVSSIAILVGAIPGALPPMIGWLAFASYANYDAWVLFAIQFIWQFPHFWAIGWMGADEYKKAGFKLWPTPADRNKYAAAQIIIYTVALILSTFVPVVLGQFTIITAIANIILGSFMLKWAITLYQTCAVADARKLMLASVTYLPLIQIVMVIDKLIQ
ncbi:MAG: protoheme IX farnesyltransferase [Sphingobacteriales bacterium]|jgi:protoheme IX farnesyltransferase|nr:protoheme IX farnesyltransferase [Sphingobacteriales bacterium]MBP9142696.1 heme o synthase [Chitinophagales bacterium]MDA0198874.1 heme o synthase [Bacteroidota bacterium]MBK6889776.1 protoheme IX farnesyltransferase [Sphingobacteriales bacterium]MBK7527708.1 protoheme IX farnesyltransferase [Sphingobacteriales bacterium]